MMQSKKEYGALSEGKYYVDKTEALERELTRFPSLYVEGAAACGKTTAVKMLLARHKEVLPVVFWMDREMSVPQLFFAKLEETKARMEEHPVWAIFENMPKELPGEMVEAIIRLIEELPQSGRVILLGREPMEEKFLALLWKQDMELLSQKVLLFTNEEVKAFSEYARCASKADEIYKITGGWAGCVDLILRLYEKNPANTGKRVKDLRQSYEVDRYIKKEILEVLAPQEKMLMDCAARCPWLEETLCREVLGMENPAGVLRRLERNGLLQLNEKKQRWTIAPLFEDRDSGLSDSLFLKKLSSWYEAQGYIDEVIYCLMQSEDEDAYKDCVLRHYQKIQASAILHTDVMKWGGTSSQHCYLRGLYRYAMQDFAGLGKEMRRVSKGADKQSEEIYLNMAYMNPEVSLEEWLDLLEKTAEKRGPVQLFHMLGETCTFLSGIRDLSGLFNGSRQEVRRKEKIWKTCLGEKEWQGYLFARSEYYLEIGNKENIDDTLSQILVGEDAGGMDIYRAKIYLLCKFWQVYQDERIVQGIKRRVEGLPWERSQPYEESIESLLNLQLLWNGEQSCLDWWKRALSKGQIIDIKGENWIAWWCRAKGYLYLNRYEKSGEILENLIPYLRTYQRSYFLAEALFMQAIVKWKTEDKSQALRYVIESFLIADAFRYVGFYTRYGNAGIEVLEAYISWRQSSEPESWSRKKKYNYGNVLRMPFADYVGVILRQAKKSRASYPDMKVDMIEEKLTMMERIVLQDIGRGMSNAEICQALNVKLPTVKGHLYSLYKKLGVNSRVQAVVKAKEQGILK